MTVYQEMISAITDTGDFVAILRRCVSKTGTCQSRRDITDWRCHQVGSDNVSKMSPLEAVSLTATDHPTGRRTILLWTNSMVQ